MIDREKVIGELKEGIDFAYHRCHCGLAVTMEMALELLKAQEPVEREQPRCKDCLHYHKGVHYKDGTKIPDNVGYCEVHERRFFGEMDYCSYHTGV